MEQETCCLQNFLSAFIISVILNLYRFGDYEELKTARTRKIIYKVFPQLSNSLSLRPSISLHIRCLFRPNHFKIKVPPLKYNALDLSNVKFSSSHCHFTFLTSCLG